MNFLKHIIQLLKSNTNKYYKRVFNMQCYVYTQILALNPLKA